MRCSWGIANWPCNKASYTNRSLEGILVWLLIIKLFSRISYGAHHRYSIFLCTRTKTGGTTVNLPLDS